jgi:NADH-quinone oxidoreductase subunit J
LRGPRAVRAVTTQRLVFDAAAVLTILFAAVMTVHRHPVKSVLALVVSFFGLAVCFVMLSAPFIAAIQVIVYAGAILVLFLFVIMLLNLQQEAEDSDQRPVQRVLSLAVALGLGGLLTGAVLRSGDVSVNPTPKPVIPALDEIPILGRLLFSDYLLAFEALSVLLLVAAVGALILAKRRMD